MEEARARLLANGPNELKEEPRTGPVRILIAQFQSLLIWVLLGAGVLSGILGQWVDAAAIVAIVMLNAVIGFYQEFNAEKSIALLRQLTAPQARVLRDGHPVMVPARDLVLGDVMVLESGDVVPSDGRLMELHSLTCIESALTGESETVEKHAGILPGLDVALGDRVNMVFAGTSVAGGTGRAVVVATAMNTELGRIAGLITEAGKDQKTPLQQELNSFARVLVWSTLGIIIGLFLLGLARGIGAMELLLTSISLAVAAVPEGLPAVVTVALALGVSRMARRKALIRRLAAVETLGSTTVICTDKTGTLTVGQMTVRSLYVNGRSHRVTGEGYGPEGEILPELDKPSAPDPAALLELATVFLACNHSRLVEENAVWKVVGDPTEAALMVAAKKMGANRENILGGMVKRGEIPFDSDRKLSSMIFEMSDRKLRAFTNGAPGALLKRCNRVYTDVGVRALTGADRTNILAQASAMARQSLRVLCSANRDIESAGEGDFTSSRVEHDLVFIGLAGMQDPARPEAKAAVGKCLAAGIRVVMITGDHPETATAIGRDLGIVTDSGVAMAGAELDALSEADLKGKVGEISVFARVTAEHKLRIVRGLKSTGNVVAMTGDGINDAPAIQGADIGIAMGLTGTEVTKQSADMIITDDNFSTIVDAVEEGRGIYDNIRKTLQYLLAGNTAEVLLMTVCLVVGMPAPLVPIHLLWINLVTDGLPALCLATDSIGADVMKRPPRSPVGGITNAGFVRALVLTSLLTAGVSLVAFVMVRREGTLESARSAAFSVLVFAELLRSFGARSEVTSVWRIPLSTNLKLVAVVLVTIAIQFLSLQWAPLGRVLKTTTMPLVECLGLLGLGMVPLVVLECVKLWRRKVPGGGRNQPG